jgi:hypothetical protein
MVEICGCRRQPFPLRRRPPCWVGHGPPLRKKQNSERIEQPKEPSRTNFVNLMDALRRSVAQEKRAPASAKKGRKRIAGQTEMPLPIAGKKGKEQTSGKTQRTAETSGLNVRTQKAGASRLTAADVPGSVSPPHCVERRAVETRY